MVCPIKGMIVREEDVTTGVEGWIFRTGGGRGWSGVHDTRYLCMKNAASSGFDFFIVEDK